MGNKRKISMIAAVAAIVVAVPLFASAIGDFLNPAPAQAQSGQVLQANTIQVVGQGSHFRCAGRRLHLYRHSNRRQNCRGSASGQCGTVCQAGETALRHVQI